MFDVFTEEIEVLIKDGVANLYWYKDDLRKAWLRAGVPQPLCLKIAGLKDPDGKSLTKRLQMDQLYQELRTADFNLRLRISREFVRTLVEHKNFAPQDYRHRTEVAERCALKLRAIIAAQETQREQLDRARRQTAAAARPTYEQELAHVRDSFNHAHSLAPQQRGYALERIFGDLMRISGIQVEEPFKNVGEQLDAAIKHDGTYYLVELKWFAGKLEPKHIGAFYFKVDGKMGARGIVIAMNGYTDGVLATLPAGKELKVLLLDGNHIANVIYGHYHFESLLHHAIRHATLKGQLYCPHQIQ
ncbi:MAG: restriction endonuclease [Alphaproteobacteria bacterium]